MRRGEKDAISLIAFVNEIVQGLTGIMGEIAKEGDEARVIDVFFAEFHRPDRF